MTGEPDVDFVEELNRDDSLDLEGISRFGLDDYRIALIPPEAGVRAEQFRPQASVNSGVIILSLTWRELRTRPVHGPQGKQTRQNYCAQFGKVHIDFESMEVRSADRVVSLTAMEFKVLKFFVLNPRRAVSRNALLNQVWGYNDYPYSRTVDNHIMRLRRKLEADGSRPVHFLTVHGVGYKFIP